MELCSSVECTGCGACYNSCPHGCISMVDNGYGFKYPKINNELCVNCGLCAKACPKINTMVGASDSRLYSLTYVEDEQALKKSSSGGAAYVFGKKIIEKGGVVFGAVYDCDMHVKHVEIDNIDDLAKTQGSKYVQSELGDCLKKIKQYLLGNRPVFFVGTPCQVAGVKKYTESIDTSNLYTCDLLCGGVPSPKVFEKYVDYLNEKFKIKIQYLNFRSKKYGYGYLVSAIDAQNGKTRILSSNDSLYIKCVGAGYIRESCFGCEYANTSRIGDLTIGDYWHLRASYSQWYKGISLVLCNSEKGKDLLDSVKESTWIEEIDFSNLFKSQSCAIDGSKKRPKDYDSFFEDANNLQWQDLSKKYLVSKSTKERVKERIPVSIMARLRNFRRKKSK